MKTIDEIYQELAAEFQSKSGAAAAGSGELAARFYAVAAQLYGLYNQAEWTRKQCFPQTAQAEQLDLHAALRGVERRQAACAGGTVRFFAAEPGQTDTEIPAGTVCMTAPGVRFLTVRAGVIPAGETQADVEVVAAQAGAQGNVAAGSVIFMALPPVGVSACTNPERFSGGQDTEGDEELRRRVMETYHRLANGANTAFYEQQALGFDGVAAVKVLPRNRGVSTVDIVVTAPGGLPDQELLDALSAHFAAVREIAVDVQVMAPQVLTVDLSAQVTPKEGYDAEQVRAAAQQALEGWFTGDKLGSAVLVAELNALLFSVEGVANCAVLLPESDTQGESITLPQLGQLTVSLA